MATAKLPIHPLPADYKKWARWLQGSAQIALGTVNWIENTEQIQEEIPYHSLWILVYRWDDDVEMWAAEEADLDEADLEEADL